MKRYLIVAVLPLKSTLELRDPDDGSTQYYRLPRYERARDYRVGAYIEL